MLGGWHTQGEEGRINVQPWYRPVGVAKNLQSETQEGRTGLPARVSGRHMVRGWQSSPILECAQENRQGWWKRSILRWDRRQLSPWTRPSAPGCGDTLKALASEQHLIQGGDRPCIADGSGVAIDWVTGRSYSSARRAGKSRGSLSERGCPWSWTLERCCGKRTGPLKVTPRGVCFGWKGDRTWVRLVTVPECRREARRS